MRVFVLKQKTSYEMIRRIVGSEMGMRDSNYWSGANRHGFYAGLISGSLVCLLGLVIPLIFTDFTEVLLVIISQYLPINTSLWDAITLLALGCCL